MAASRFLVLFAALSLACGDDPTPLGPSRVVNNRGLGPVVAFEVVSNRPRGVVSVGDTLRFVARATHVSGGVRDVDADWRVTPAPVLQIQTPPAVFVARRPGAVTVSAAYVPPGGDSPHRASLALTVVDSVVDPVRFVIDGWPVGADRHLVVGAAHDLALVAEYADGTRSGPLVADWSSSASLVASVSSAGSLEALAVGSFTVTATAAGGAVTSPHWTVSPGFNQPPSVTAFCRPCTVLVGNGVTLSAATASDPDGDSLTVRWTVAAGVVRYPNRFRTDWFLPEHSGSFVATVVVTDPGGLTGTDSVLVVVTTPG